MHGGAFRGRPGVLDGIGITVEGIISEVGFPESGGQLMDIPGKILIDPPQYIHQVDMGIDAL